MIKYNLKKKNAGFTLIEALVATSILMVAVAAPITIAQKGLSSAIYTKNQMIASYLAQDAMEYVINKRDEITQNNNNDWGDLFEEYFGSCIVVDENPEDDAVGCQIDTVTDDTANITTYDGDKLKIGDEDSDDTYPNFYQYEGGTETSFTRQVKISLIDDAALVAVTVNWSQDDSFKEVTVKSLIYNY